MAAPTDESVLSNLETGHGTEVVTSEGVNGEDVTSEVVSSNIATEDAVGDTEKNTEGVDGKIRTEGVFSNIANSTEGVLSKITTDGVLCNVVKNSEGVLGNIASKDVLRNIVNKTEGVLGNIAGEGVLSNVATERVLKSFVNGTNVVFSNIVEGILYQCYSDMDDDCESEKLRTYVQKVQRNRSENSRKSVERKPNKHKDVNKLDRNKLPSDKQNKLTRKQEKKHHNNKKQRGNHPQTDDLVSQLPLPPTVSGPIVAALWPSKNVATGGEDTESTTNSTTNDYSEEGDDDCDDSGSKKVGDDYQGKKGTKMDLISSVGLTLTSAAAVMDGSQNLNNYLLGMTPFKHCAMGNDPTLNDPTVCTITGDDATLETGTVTTTATQGATSTTTGTLSASSRRHIVLDTVVIENLPKDMGGPDSKARRRKRMRRLIRRFGLLNCSNNKKVGAV